MTKIQTPPDQTAYVWYRPTDGVVLQQENATLSDRRADWFLHHLFIRYTPENAREARHRNVLDLAVMAVWDDLLAAIHFGRIDQGQSEVDPVTVGQEGSDLGLGESERAIPPDSR